MTGLGRGLVIFFYFWERNNPHFILNSLFTLDKSINKSIILTCKLIKYSTTFALICNEDKETLFLIFFIQFTRIFVYVNNEIVARFGSGISNHAWLCCDFHGQLMIVAVTFVDKLGYNILIGRQGKRIFDDIHTITMHFFRFFLNK